MRCFARNAPVSYSVEMPEKPVFMGFPGVFHVPDNPPDNPDNSGALAASLLRLFPPAVLTPKKPVFMRLCAVY